MVKEGGVPPCGAVKGIEVVGRRAAPLAALVRVTVELWIRRVSGVL